MLLLKPEVIAAVLSHVVELRVRHFQVPLADSVIRCLPFKLFSGLLFTQRTVCAGAQRLNENSVID